MGGLALWVGQTWDRSYVIGSPKSLPCDPDAWARLSVPAQISSSNPPALPGFSRLLVQKSQFSRVRHWDPAVSLWGGTLRAP